MHVSPIVRPTIDETARPTRVGTVLLYDFTRQDGLFELEPTYAPLYHPLHSMTR